jgi:MFS family permease
MLEERPVADDLAFPPRMYQVADPQVVAQGGRALLKRRIRAHVSRTVLLLGVTSMLTDISSEMVTTILPLYLTYSLGMSPLQFGVIDGIQQGASSLVRVFGGFFADRRGRYKEVAVVGYGLSAFTRIALLVAGRSWSLIGGVIFLDRAGKGIRTAPRDALISLSTPEEDLGTAFGVHRALDTAGAMIGPVIAFAVLYAAPHGFHSIFVLSFCFALVGLAVLVLFVENRPERVDDAPARPLGARDVAALFALPGFALLTCIGFALAVATTSDGFIYLGLQNTLDFAARNLPLLYVATSLVYMLLAVPVGRVADRLGRSQVFIGGYLLLVVVYASIVLPSIGAAGTVLVVVALGTFYAATDGVLMALASGLLPAHARATGLSLLVTATSLGRLVASIAFGALWTLIGVHAAVIVFAVALTAIGAVSAIALTRSTRTSAA